MSSELMEAIAGGAVAPGSPDPLALCEGPDGLRARVRHHMDSLVAGEMSLEDFASRLADCADIEVKNAYARAIDALAPAHPETKWARVPVGESCEWCVMLGSLGYYFHSARSAARGSHAKCNCLIVPSIGGRDPDIGGYDPDALYMQRVEGLKRECAENNCGQRKERDFSVEKREGNWVKANPIESIYHLVKAYNTEEITKHGKVRFTGDSDYQVIVDALNSYFRIMRKTVNAKGKETWVYVCLDGSFSDRERFEASTHFRYRM